MVEGGGQEWVLEVAVQVLVKVWILAEEGGGGG